MSRALVFYEHRNGFELGNNSDINAFKLYVCTAEYRPLHDLHRCYNLQRRSIVQRRAPRHPLETWYFWLGSALLVSVIFVVSHPDITHVSTRIIEKTLRNLISRELMKTRYL